MTDARDEEMLEESTKLVSDIRKLKVLISQSQNSLDTMTFEDIFKDQSPNIEQKHKTSAGRLVDVEAVIKNELFSYAGLCCKKISQEFVIAFQSMEKNVYANKNWIQLFKQTNGWRLGKWIMPMSVDVKAILSKYSLDSPEFIKLFLRECKREVDCYNDRQRQFRELETFFNESQCEGCSVETDLAYMRLIIRLIKASTNVRINVYVAYRTSEALPWSLKLDWDGDVKLTDEETKDLKAVLRVLKQRDLKDAMETILSSEGSPFVWKKITEDDSIIELNESQKDEVLNVYSKILKNKRHVTKKRVKVASGSDDNAKENLTVDDTDRSSRSLSDEEQTSHIDEAAMKKNKIKIAKIAARKKFTDKTNVDATLKKKTMNSELQQKQILSRESLTKNSLKNKNPNQRTVLEMLKPKENRLKPISKVKNSLTKSPSQNDRIQNREGQKWQNPTSSKSAVRSHEKLTSSTPKPGRSIDVFGGLEDNISSIDRQRTIMAEKNATANRANDKTRAQINCDKSDSADSDVECLDDVVNNSKLGLLKDLQALRDRATMSKGVKRKAKSPMRGKNKVTRK